MLWNLITVYSCFHDVSLPCQNIRCVQARCFWAICANTHITHTSCSSTNELLSHLNEQCTEPLDRQHISLEMRLKDSQERYQTTYNIFHKWSQLILKKKNPRVPFSKINSILNCLESTIYIYIIIYLIYPPFTDKVESTRAVITTPSSDPSVSPACSAV